MHVKHIFFDFDGVLLDSLADHKKAFIQAFINNNIDYEEFVYIPGISSESLVKNFLQKKVGK
jgi:beta-phosphoglucomutase-like phosphatase (HAD superfamily)